MPPPTLVGYEGSERSADALALARVLATASDGRIVVAGVHTIDPFVSIYAPDLNGIDQDLRAGVERAAGSCDGEAIIVNSSSVARGLHELAEETGARTVVLGSSHRGPLGRTLGGGVAQRLLHGSPAAVAVAPAGLHGRDAGLNVIGVGVDGSPESEAAVAEASRLAEAQGARVRLLAAGGRSSGDLGDDVFYQLPDFAEVIRAKWREHLDRAASLAADSVPTETELLAGDPARALEHEAPSLDLLVVGSRGYGPVRRVVLGSVSGHLLQGSAACPILVVPRGAAGTTAS